MTEPLKLIITTLMCAGRDADVSQEHILLVDLQKQPGGQVGLKPPDVSRNTRTNTTADRAFETAGFNSS